MTAIETLSKLLSGLLLAVATALLSAMMVLTAVDVFMRYVMAAPIFGASEMIQFMLAIVILAGLALVSRDNEHIVVSLFEAPLRRRFGRLYDGVVAFFNLAGSVLLTVLLVDHAGLVGLFDQRSIVLGWPLATLAYVLAGLAAIASFMAVRAWLVRARPAQHGSAE
ncbi:MAG: TRAP transporter small permease [Azospirillaceae bacterium]